jgi:hypothetical protein
MVNVGSKIGTSKRDVLIVPRIGTPGMASRQRRTSGRVAATVGAER